VEALASLTLEELAEELGEDEEEGEEGEGAEPVLELPGTPVLTPDAGKIRFAEDIMDDYRGAGRGPRRARRGPPPGGARGNRRGGGR
jgi:hypothetical protein